jgi:hypothetical protein
VLDVLSTAGDLAVNLAASAIAAVAVVVAGRFRLRRRRGRLAGFLGVGATSRNTTLVVPGQAGDRSRVAVHRSDVAAMIEVSGLVREAGAEGVLVAEGVPRSGDGAEICVAGPHANARTAAYLRNLLPGLAYDDYTGPGAELTIRVGERSFARVEGQREYVVLARLRPPSAHPVLLISGQTPTANLAAAKYLTANVQQLIKEHGDERSFCLILLVRDSGTYGTGWTELMGDYFPEASR